ncbi:putative guanine deaminase [Madurella mycetomatis]|uniref:Guanine deaminase n=1 Tax=Madurella mycetomatis TaxID=100816 RepID=A0A175WCX8_9PEZI|nr:putative guanine deaminase [Madurella mycetomatis]
MTLPIAFLGPIIHSLSVSELEVIPCALLVVNREGRVAGLLKDVDPRYTRHVLESLNFPPDMVDVRFLAPGQFLIPGFVDTHNHAPQWAQRGLGQGMHILDWLDAITFPNEAQFRDPDYARRIYASCVDGFLRQGVTTASYYGSIHGEATKILAETCREKGQRALVGKCNMSRNAPDYYRDASVEESLRVTEECIAHIRSIDPQAELVRHVLTPRFAISCDPELLHGLGEIARRNPDLPIQTHFNEAEQEMKATKELFPQFSNEADLYEHYGLLGRRSILAHCCHMTDYEMERLKVLGCGVAHCPISNMTVGGGFMAAPVREFLRRGIRVGLGTDSGGGFSSSILDAVRQAMIASHAREVTSKGQDKGLSIAEVFYLATLGGAEVCGLEDKIGNFQDGKDFDAIVVGTQGADQGIMTMVEEGDNLMTVFEKFIMTGDDRNVTEVYVRGVKATGK